MYYVPLFGSGRYNDSKNKQILLHTMYYIQSTKHFEDLLLTDQYWFRSITTIVFFPFMSAKALSTMQPFIH